MLLHTQVYLIDRDEQKEFLPYDESTEELAPATIRVSAIEFIYPLDAEHTQLCTVNDRIKVKTSYNDILELMEQSVRQENA